MLIQKDYLFFFRFRFIYYLFLRISVLTLENGHTMQRANKNNKLLCETGFQKQISFVFGRCFLQKKIKTQIILYYFYFKNRRRNKKCNSYL